MTDFLSYADLERLTGFTYRTIRKRLSDLPSKKEEGREVLFSSKEALPLLFAVSDSEEWNLSRERAKLAKVQTEKIELEIGRLRGELVDRKEWLDCWGKALVSFKDKITGVGLRMSGEIFQSQSEEVVYELLCRYSNSALDSIVEDALGRSQESL
jgi:hypothetical protein